VIAGPALDSVLGRAPTEVAPRLLGAVLRRESRDGVVAVRLTEVEAYDGAADPGSHAFRGRTARNAVMFGPPSHLYVYLIYGMHHCCNVVTRHDGVAGAVLLRAGEVVEGVELARDRRGGAADRDLARGPGRLCRALGLALDDDGVDLRTGSTTLHLSDRAMSSRRLATGPRVGLRQAAERPWRYWVRDHPTVSRFVPAKPRTTSGSGAAGLP
jgi:DNA-3-methyladenine glycosylase